MIDMNKKQLQFLSAMSDTFHTNTKENWENFIETIKVIICELQKEKGYVSLTNELSFDSYIAECDYSIKVIRIDENNNLWVAFEEEHNNEWFKIDKRRNGGDGLVDFYELYEILDDIIENMEK